MNLTKRQQEINRELSSNECDISKLRNLAWHGLERHQRASAWKILLNYLPVTSSSRQSTLQRKRQEYFQYQTGIYENREQHLTERLQRDLKQIHDDIPRTEPGLPLFKQPEVQEIMTRILYIWSIRHPASGYYQGINDICSVVFLVFLSEHSEEDLLTEVCEMPGCINEIEADVYWCLSTILDSIEDFYFPESPGITRALAKIDEIIHRIDARLSEHLRSLEIEMVHFSFRWFNCIFIREFPLPLVFMLWDTLISEADGFSKLSVYVAAALIINYSADLVEQEFNEVMMFLEDLPTRNWKEEDLGALVSQGFVYYSLFESAPNHLRELIIKEFTLKSLK